jgi:hypothetical protein
MISKPSCFVLKIKALCVFILLASPFISHSQSYTISGFITDSENGEAITGANIFNPRTVSGTQSNTYGFYSITLPSDTVELRFSYVGYTTEKLVFMLNRDTSINVELLPSTTLSEVEITAEAADRIEESSSMSTINIPIHQIKAVPGLLGETDVLKVLQLLPGVQSGGEGQSGIYVRGGSPDQNLVLLDGVPVYNASHLFGFFSVFNADAIRDVNLIKGGFPARYGGRLSSVVDISMKEGNMREFKGTASIGLVAARATLEGPIVRDRTSFIVSFRRTYLDVLMRPLIKQSFRETDSEGNMGYYFYDLNAKINHRISKKDRLFFSIYGGDDRFFFWEKYRDFNEYSDESEVGLGWGNITSALRWNRQWNPQLFSNTTLTFSRYRMSTNIAYRTNDLIDNHEDFVSLKYDSGIRDWGMKVNFDYLPSPDHYIRFGGNITLHRFNPGLFEFKQIDTEIDYRFEETVGQPKVNATELFFYVEDDYSITDRLKINGGLHFSGFLVQDKIYPSVQPRFSARYLLPQSSSVKLAFSTMQQNIHLLTFEGIGLPTDLWLPSTKIIEPQKSWQLAAGYARSINRSLEVSAEVYYKEMDNVLSYQDGAGIFDVSDWQTRVTQGKGYSYGLELFLQKKTGRLNGWVGYTLSWTNREFESLNFGERFPYRYDRRHDISVVGMYDINDNISFSGTWVYGTGNAVTLPVSSYVGSSPDHRYRRNYQFYGSRNDFRMKSYHRLDFGFNFKKQRKKYLRTFSIGAYNAYSRKNPFFIYLGEEYTYNPSTGQHEYKESFRQVSLFPLIPYFTWTADF